MTTIKLKNGSGAPLAGDLVAGEPALDLTNKRLYTEDSGGTVIEVGTNPTSLTTGTFTSTGIDDNAASTAITIDSSQNVGIGTSSPSNTVTITNGSSGATEANGSIVPLMIENSSSAYINFLTPNNANAGFLFSDPEGNNVGQMQYLHGSDALVFATNASERMRIDSSGNVGIGTSSIDFQASNRTVVHVEGSAGALLALEDTGAKSYLFQTGNDLLIENDTASGNMIFGTNASTERMRIDSSGNLGLGVVPSAWNTAVKAYQVVNSSLVGTSTQMLLSQNYFFDGSDKYIADGLASQYYQVSGTHQWRIAPSGTAGNAITFTQAMTLDASGNLLVGRSSALNNAHTFTKSQANNVVVFENQASSGTVYGAQVRFSQQDPNDTSSLFYGAYALSGGSLVTRFLVRSNGGIANYQSNDSNLSDERVKRDISPLGSMWDKFKALEIVTFKYKDQTHDDDNIGVIAQQVESVAPEFVSNDGFGETPEGEEPLKTIYTADLYHATIKALQEAMTRIETLEAEVSALKGAN